MSTLYIYIYSYQYIPIYTYNYQDQDHNYLEIFFGDGHFLAAILMDRFSAFDAVPYSLLVAKLDT